MAVRGRDFGEVAAVLDAHARRGAGSADGPGAGAPDAGGRTGVPRSPRRRAAHASRSGRGSRAWKEAAGATRSEASQLREQLAAGLREAERSQREVKKLLGQADAAKGDERLALLRRAYERWETAPGLAARLADELLAAAEASIEAGDEDGALTSASKCERCQVYLQARWQRLKAWPQAIRARRQVKTGLADAAAAIEAADQRGLCHHRKGSLKRSSSSAVAPALARAKELAPEFDTLRGQAEDGRRRSLAAKAHAAESEALAAAGDWHGAAEALAAG